ncbi:MAG TPA: cytochrome P450 [Acidimicrobiales bacterium]
MTDGTVDNELAFDVMDQTKTKDWAFLARLRAACPVSRPSDSVVFTARYEETAKAFRDAKTFSSVGDMRAPGVTVSIDESFLGELDAPLHPRIRRLLLRGFTPAAAERAEGWTRDNVRRRLQAVKDAGGGDLMADFAIPLPGSIAAHELGFPDDLHDQLMGWCNDLLHSTWPTHGKTDRGEGIAGAFPELAAIIDEQIAMRRTPTPDGPADLLALMVQTVEDDGWRISEQHIRTLAVNIMAGSLSASYMLGNLLYRYVDESTGFARVLQDDQSLIPAAVEESLRYEAPVMFLFRTARTDTALGGCPIKEGDHVMLGIGAANRDPAVYSNPEEFRLDRSGEPEHLSFGAGPHLCLGNHLTRMVGKVTLEEMLATFPPGTLDLAPGYTWECVNHLMEYGPETLDVVVRS